MLAVCGAIASGCHGAHPREPAEPPRATASPKLAIASTPAPTPEQQGHELYARMCSVCHGEHGEGYKADRAPAIGGPEFLASVSDDFLRRTIAGGRFGTTMSAWSKDHGGPLTAADIDALVALLHSWSTQPKAALDERPLQGDAMRGAAVFAAQCQRCHGERGMRGPEVRIGSRALLLGASNGFLRYAIRVGRSRTPMAGFAGKLSDAQIEDVVAYVRSLQDTAPPAMAPARPPPPLPLGPVPLNPHGPEPRGFERYPGTTTVDVVHAELKRHARMAILDARAPSDYANEHIAGAVSVPFYDPSPYLKALPKDAWLVCYCACPHAESGQLAEKLMVAGFTKVTVLREGLGGWIQKHFETRKDPKP